MGKYKATHVISTPDKQHALGSHVSDSDFTDKAEVDRLLKVGAIEPLEGYERPEPRPDQGDDPTPRGVVSPDWFTGLTPDEIDAQIAALQVQRESAVVTQKRQEEVAAVNAENASETPRRGRPPRVTDTAQA